MAELGLKTIITASLIYWTTALDLIVIVCMLFCTFQRRQHLQIVVGQLIGSILLIMVSLFLALVLHLIPAGWVLGLLGLVPIWFGGRMLLFGEDEEEGALEALERRPARQLVWTVVIITFASCGPDNIGLMTPYFLTLAMRQVCLALIVMLINIGIMVFIAHWIAGWPRINAFIAKYSRWLIGTVYVIVGLMVIWEGGTVQHFL